MKGNTSNDNYLQNKIGVVNNYWTSQCRIYPPQDYSHYKVEQKCIEFK